MLDFTVVRFSDYSQIFYLESVFSNLRYSNYSVNDLLRYRFVLGLCGFKFELIEGSVLTNEGFLAIY